MYDYTPDEFGRQARTRGLTRQEAVMAWADMVGRKNALMDDCVAVQRAWDAAGE